MNYLETLAYIESLSPTLEKPGMERIRAFMTEQGNCQNLFKVVHVGGTNGKGSTVAILDSIFRQTGTRIGRFTGPHLLKWNERFHVDGVAIDDREFARLATDVRAQSEEFGRRNALGPLTWFEFLTALAFQWFAQEEVELAVVEVGLGGRFDATNVVDNVIASVITNIDLDHTHILGNTVEEIAFEKAGIIRNAIPLVTGAKTAALQVIADRCQLFNAPMFVCDSARSVSSLEGNDIAKFAKEVFDRTRKSLSLCGDYQENNAFLATVAFLVSGFCRDRSAIEQEQILKHGFENVYWPGRFQYLPALHVLLDGAHNPAGAVALRAALNKTFPDVRIHFVIGCFENKNAPKIIDELVAPGDAVYLSEAATRRSTYDKQRLADYCTSKQRPVSVHASLADAWRNASANRSGDELIVVTGSFATVKELMIQLDWQCVEDGLAECARICGSTESDLTVERF